MFLQSAGQVCPQHAPERCLPPYPPPHPPPDYWSKRGARAGRMGANMGLARHLARADSAADSARNGWADMSAKLDELRAAHARALAAEPRRLSRGADSALKREAREMAASVKAEAARAANDARDAQEEREYAATTGRMAALSARLVEIRRERAAITPAEGVEPSPMVAARLAVLAADERNARTEQSVLFARPIVPAYDLADSGRFMRSIRWHARTVGLMALDAEDILSEALALCYAATGEPERVVETYPTPYALKSGAPVILPTVGGVYWGIKTAYRHALDAQRKMLRGMVSIRSIDELAAHGIEPVETFTLYGEQYSDPADLLDALMSVGETVDARGTVDGERRAIVAERRERERIAERRDRMARLSGGSPVHVIAVQRLAYGDTLAGVARDLGITVASLTAALRACQWATDRPRVDMGARRVSSPEPSTNGPVQVWRMGADGERVRVS